LKITPLASSSKGNAYVVDLGGTVLLIDDGLSYRTLCARLTAAGYSADAIAAVLITHSHVDHISGLPTLVKRHPSIGIYANVMTAEAVAADLQLEEDRFVCFENGQSFEIGACTVSAFSIPHDTSDPVGYRITGSDGERSVTYFHGTDIGAPLDSVGIWLREADCATLESNHDPAILMASGRPPSLIRRIAGSSGHLSNAEAAELVTRFASPNLRRLYLAHLSQDCNSPELAAHTMREALRSIGREDVQVEVCAP